MRKIKQIILLFFLISCISGCKKIKTFDEILIKQKEYGIIYFVRDIITTDVLVSCNNYLSELDYFIYSLSIEDESLINILLSVSKMDEHLGADYVIDVRYRIELEDKVICIDDVGNYSIEGKYLGKLSNFQLLLDYIEKHRESSIKLKEDFPFVDDK